MDHELNVIGAMVVLLGDRLRDATEEAAGMAGALPAAVVALHEWAGGRTIETLAGGLRLSHSRTVRVVDRLAADGLAVRERDPGDGRGVLVDLTPAGRRLGGAVLAARAAALEQAVGSLEPADRAALAHAAEALLAPAATSRRAARAICRLCDAHACGHHDGRCPVTNGANAAEGQSGGGAVSSPS